MTNGEGPVEVLVGVHGDIEWRVMVSGTTSDLMTMLELRRGGRRLSSSGFGGPALPPGSLVDEWRGRSGDQPWFVMARAHPAVTRLVAQTDRGRQVELTLGEVDPRSGLRFAVAGLPDGEVPGVLLVEAAGHPDRAVPQPVPRSPSWRRRPCGCG